MKKTAVSGSFDNIASRDVRFLEEAADTGLLTVCLWSDAVVEQVTGSPPKFPLAERMYFLNAVRWVDSVKVIETMDDEKSPAPVADAGRWVVSEKDASPDKASFCKKRNIQYLVVPESRLSGFPCRAEEEAEDPDRKKVIVTGCYDWFHTGHIRFFEEASAFGNLYVCLGNDVNIERLKGAGHPMFREDERRYLVQSIKFVWQALISAGSGWLDAESEIERIKPDIYIVNEDGDKPEKREYCDINGIEYVILKRRPAAGLPRRQSTDLRGF